MYKKKIITILSFLIFSIALITGAKCEVQAAQQIIEENDTTTPIWIGDSRTYELYSVLPSPLEDNFICLGGARYEWFETTAISALKDMLANNSDRDVFINMGANDCSISTYQEYQFFIGHLTLSMHIQLTHS